MQRSSGARTRLADDFARGVGMLRFKARIGAAAFRRLALGLIVGWAGIVLGYVALTQPPETVPAALRWSVARLIDGIGLGLSERVGRTVQTDHGPEHWSFATIRRDPWHGAQFTRLLQAAMTGALIGVVAIPLVGVAGVLTTARIGRRAGAAQQLRGREFTSDRDLARRLQRAGVASDLAIGRVPLVRNAETGHLLLLGAPGAGKTQAIIHMLEHIRERGEAAIVYDIKGSLFGQFHDPACGDVILNPLDQRGAPWSPWAEITTRADCKRLAESLIPLGSEREPYWGVAARMLFAACLDRLREDPERSVEQLLDLLLTLPRAQMRQILAGTPAAKIFEEGAEKPGLSIELHVAPYLEALGYLPADAGGADDASIRGFVAAVDQARDGALQPWLWLPVQRAHLDALRPLISCWADAAAAALLSHPAHRERRLWIILDELNSLQTLPSVLKLMGEGREFGACVVIGVQSTAQLEAPSAYGREGARALLGTCNTKAIFRVAEPEGQRWASAILGQVEQEQARESARYDAAGGDDVAIHRHTERRVTPLVLPTEIGALPTLQCYVQLPDAWPIARTALPPPTEFDATTAAPFFIATTDKVTAADALQRKATTRVRPRAGDEPRSNSPKRSKTKPADADASDDLFAAFGRRR